MTTTLPSPCAAWSAAEYRPWSSGRLWSSVSTVRLGRTRPMPNPATISATLASSGGTVPMTLTVAISADPTMTADPVKTRRRRGAGGGGGGGRPAPRATPAPDRGAGGRRGGHRPEAAARGERGGPADDRRSGENQPVAGDGRPGVALQPRGKGPTERRPGERDAGESHRHVPLVDQEQRYERLQGEVDAGADSAQQHHCGQSTRGP